MNMNMGILTEKDLKEAIKLERRKQYEEDRKQRIFNAKQRLFGLDLVTLEKQIVEKAKQRLKDAECERSYEQQTHIMQDMVKAKELELENRRRAAESDLNYYRCNFQRREQRREFDLSYPDAKKNSKPARVADDDINLGVSSAQIFSGEDLGFKERRQRQKQQQRSWLTQQMHEKRCATENHQKAEDLLQQNIYSVDKHLEDMAQYEDQVRKQIVENIRQYNADMTKHKQEERERLKREKYEDDMAEIYNMLTSDMLTENPDVAQSRINPNKKIAFMYRGMSDKELAAIGKDQRQQMIELEKRHTNQKLMSKQWEQYCLDIDRELCLKELDLEQRRQQQIDKVVEFNYKLAKEQRDHKEYANKVLNINQVSAEFYEQFNRNTR